MVYQKKVSNFLLRLVSACILAPIVYGLIHLSGMYFTAMILVAAVIMGGEWFQMTYNKNIIWKLSGVAYISLACIALLWLIHQHFLDHHTVKLNGVATVTSIFVLVWANDIGAYIVGRIVGGPKLCPKISPNKTWSGFVGGAIFAMALTPVVEEYIPVAGFVVAVLATLGDLLESWVKRQCKVKDSGNLIPGHGGLLDRVDGILMVSIVVFVLAFCFQ